MSVTSLALLAARDWKLFYERALEPEIVLMSPALTVPAMISGEIDYFDDRLAKEVAKELGYRVQ